MNFFNRWRMLVAAMFLLFLIEYSPIFIPAGEYKPMLIGIPFSLWLGIIGASVGVLLTFLAAKTHRRTYKEDAE